MEQKKNKATLKTYFFTGVLVTAPVAITLYVAFELIRFVDNWVKGFIPERYDPESYLPYGIPGLGIVILLVFFTLIGMLTANFFGRALERLWNRIISRMPLISGFYGTVRKIFETVFGPERKNAFRQAVLIEYPRRGTWSIAFITGPVYEGIQKYVPDELVTVYMPTTPNPTSGYLLYLPRRDIIELDMAIDEAFKIVISAGIVNPELKAKLPVKKSVTKSKIKKGRK